MYIYLCSCSLDIYAAEPWYQVAALIDQDQYVAVASLDLSTDLDAVNVDLLLFSKAGGMFDNSYYDNSN